MKAIREREADIQRTILEGLAAMQVWAIRMNSGAMFGEYGGKKRMLRFGRRGMADILALPMGGEWSVYHFWPTWIEVKAPGKHQSADQVAFQAEVEAEGHRYLCVSSWEQVKEALR